MNYYNEFDPFAAAWLRELIKDGLIAEGEVDERSIIEVSTADLRGYKQCHFFAGIGGWSLAARLAGWSDDRPMWSGSPPCQPFSVAGNRKGQDDERHLWPVFFNLIRECQPPTVFGEQVASAIRAEWFDDLQADMETEGYATAMAVLPACSVGAPHKRERLFYVAERLADTYDSRQFTNKRRGESKGNQEGDDFRGCSSDNFSVADAERGRFKSGTSKGRPGCERESSKQGWSEIRENASYGGASSNQLADTKHEGSQGRIHRWTNEKREVVDGHFRRGGTTVDCKDGRQRPIPTEPALFPLVNGVPNRVGILRGAGNAIVPQVGAEIIKAYMES